MRKVSSFFQVLDGASIATVRRQAEWSPISTDVFTGKHPLNFREHPIGDEVLGAFLALRNRQILEDDVQKIIVTHKGRVALDTTDRGAGFVVMLPLSGRDRRV